MNNLIFQATLKAFPLMLLRGTALHRDMHRYGKQYVCVTTFLYIFEESCNVNSVWIRMFSNTILVLRGLTLVAQQVLKKVLSHTLLPSACKRIFHMLSKVHHFHMLTGFAWLILPLLYKWRENEKLQHVECTKKYTCNMKSHAESRHAGIYK